MFRACTYKGRPAVFDTVARVFYSCHSMRRAREWAAQLNRGE